MTAKDRVFMRITMPREDSQKDKEKEVEKDFREKIAIMAQFFRNLEETREMNMWNIIRTRVLKDNVFSFNRVSEVVPFLKKKIGGGEAILFKGSQNTIFLEKAVGQFLANPNRDAPLLCRRGKFWDKIREKY